MFKFAKGYFAKCIFAVNLPKFEPTWFIVMKKLHGIK